MWLCPLEAPSSGTASTRLLRIVATPSGLTPGTHTTAQAASVLSTFLCGYRADIGIPRGDDLPTIAANVMAQLKTIEHVLPCTVSQGLAPNADTVVLTMRHKGLSSQDLPVMVSGSPPFLGVSGSPGSLTLSNNTGKPAGTHTLLITTQRVAHLPGDAETPATTAAAFAASINAAHAFPVKACAAGTRRKSRI